MSCFSLSESPSRSGAVKKRGIALPRPAVTRLWRLPEASPPGPARSVMAAMPAFVSSPSLTNTISLRDYLQFN